MKVSVNENSSVSETTVEICCRETDTNVKRLRRYIEAFDSTLSVKDVSGVKKLQTVDVLYFEVVDNKTFAYTSNNTYEVSMRLYELETVLDKNYFFRCSKSLIVNISKIESLRPELTRNIRATLINGEVVMISRRFAGELKKLISSSEG